MTVSFEWSDKFLLGYHKMDEVHREFVELVNALLTCPDHEMAARLDAFAEHAARHFADENAWMESTDFPARGCHVDEHGAVLNSVKQVQALLATDGNVPAGANVAIARSLATELARWFPSHADYMDSALAQWMVRKRHGASPLVLRRGIKTKEDVAS